jgi:hypothetical protein
MKTVTESSLRNVVFWLKGRTMDNVQNLIFYTMQIFAWNWGNPWTSLPDSQWSSRNSNWKTAGCVIRHRLPQTARWTVKWLGAECRYVWRLYHSYFPRGIGGQHETLSRRSTLQCDSEASLQMTDVSLHLLLPDHSRGMQRCVPLAVLCHLTWHDRIDGPRRVGRWQW